LLEVPILGLYFVPQNYSRGMKVENTKIFLTLIHHQSAVLATCRFRQGLRNVRIVGMKNKLWDI